MHSRAAVQSSELSKLWWPRYSLRAFLVVVTLICVWVGLEANRARRQHQAVQEVQRLGGAVHFDYQYDEKAAYHADRGSSTPAWLREALGEEHFRRVVVLDLSYGGPRTGENRITSDRLALVSNLPDLTTLELGRELGITDEGLVHLRGLRQLKTLYLYNTGVEGPGLAHLRRLQNLEYLILNGTPLTDEGLARLPRLPRLHTINLAGTRITDDGLKHLANLPPLRDLSLGDTDITDAGLEHLTRLAGLKSISLHRTRVTAAGIEALQKALPKCDVSPTAVELRRKPADLALWPEGHRPSQAELLAIVKQLGPDVDLEIDRKRPGQPIVSLRFFNSDVSADSLLRLVAEAPDIEVLNLGGLLVGDEFLRKMPALPKLRYLSMRDCRITDASLPHLARQSGLRDLNLDENYITDAGLQSLKKLSSLERLSLTNNRVTYKARLELKQALPRCQMPF